MNLHNPPDIFLDILHPAVQVSGILSAPQIYVCLLPLSWRINYACRNNGQRGKYSRLDSTLEIQIHKVIAISSIQKSHMPLSSLYLLQ